MDKNSRDPVHCWLVLGKAFHAAAKYLYAGLAETGIDDTDFRILEALLIRKVFAGASPKELRALETTLKKIGKRAESLGSEKRP